MSRFHSVFKEEKAAKEKKNKEQAENPDEKKSKPKKNFLEELKGQSE